MKFKKEVRAIYEPFAMSGSATFGNLRFECPRCHNCFQISYSQNGDTESPLPTICPFCGETFVVSGVDGR